MKFREATERYEAWLTGKTPIVAADLERKHQHMAEAAFPFFRATFYRWAQVWPKACRDLERAPTVLAVGDLHVENFGTWRDIEGRLVWGVNDLDEVCPMPYTLDLVRLTTSAHLALAANHLSLKPTDACDAVLEGYTEGLESGGAPVVLGERHHWLRQLALSELRDPVLFWQKMNALPTFTGRVPKGALRGLERMLPEAGLEYRVAHRVAGLGSLGRQRFVAIADWHGGKVAREAKALLTSAWVWANGGSKKIFYEAALERAVRCRDPFVRRRGRWIVRRLAPDCSRVEMASLPKGRDEYRLLAEMAKETANIHLGTPKAVKAVRRDLKGRPARWLHAAAQTMVEATIKDWREWKASYNA